MQEVHPIAQEIRKLNEMKRRYTVQENDMTTIIHFLQVWCHYLLGARFIIKTENIATNYFQARFLVDFDYVQEFGPKKANVVADISSRKSKLASNSTVLGDLPTRIKEGLEHDLVAK
ncbi:hypothetical protein F511_37394 [Dorcoceras hygrometricum]|uniref:Reverse transcriptase RNase H-like domain-containing protein n=1 Tax=Dorcoceras hygrometricum TaxID=472368 RepID=A0A2Z7CA04_9LAMI|nr:hypothetical protein F511_37394 [Dorcoceras hygrometricum]